MTLKIEAGKFYRTRDGRKVGPMVATGIPRYPFSDNRHTYRANGEWLTGSESGADIVAEWVDEPAPLERLSSEMYPKPAEDLTTTTFAPIPALPLSGDEVKRILAQARRSDPKPDTTRATGIASKAADLVGGDRDRQHGAKLDNFNRIATVWNGWLQARKDPAAPLDAHDVGCMMVMMKLARTQSGSLNPDDYVDACGYAACAGEVAQAL